MNIQTTAYQKFVSVIKFNFTEHTYVKELKKNNPCKVSSGYEERKVVIKGLAIVFLNIWSKYRGGDKQSLVMWIRRSPSRVIYYSVQSPRKIRAVIQPLRPRKYSYSHNIGFTSIYWRIFLMKTLGILNIRRLFCQQAAVMHVDPYDDITYSSHTSIDASWPSG